MSGAELIPARNKNLQGASPDAQSVISHVIERYPVTTNNKIDGRYGIAENPTPDTEYPGFIDPDNTFPDDPSLYPTGSAVSTPTKRYPPRGGEKNIWINNRPYVGQNADIYVHLLDPYGEPSGVPVQINLQNNDAYTPALFSTTGVTGTENGVWKAEVQNLPADYSFMGTFTTSPATITHFFINGIWKDIKTLTTVDYTTITSVPIGTYVYGASDEIIAKTTAAYTIPASAPTSNVTVAATADTTTSKTILANKKTYLSRWHPFEYFIAFDRNHQPMAYDNYSTYSPALPANAKQWPMPTNLYEAAVFDDQVAYYVDIKNLVKTYGSISMGYVTKNATTGRYENFQNASGSASGNITIKYAQKATGFESTDLWVSSWGDINAYIRCTGAAYYDGFSSIANDPKALTSGASIPSSDSAKNSAYCYLLSPSGGVSQPRAFKEGTKYVYKANVPSILYQDITLIDSYKEHRHDATEVSILPDKFSPFVYVEGSSVIKRASDGMDIPIEIVIPKLKIQTALEFSLSPSGDPSTFTFTGDAYSDYTKFDLQKPVLMAYQILDADDNFDGATGDSVNADPVDYRRYQYDVDTGDSYLWKDPSIQAHQNLDISDAYDFTITKEDNQNLTYRPSIGGAESRTPGSGVITTKP